MSEPKLYEEEVSCFCGHGLFDHDDYGPCSKCLPPSGPCEAFVGCLVVAREFGEPT